MLVWRFAEPVRAIASGPLGAGLGERSWVLNATVDRSYRRHDPDRHLADLAATMALAGRGVGMLTAVDVTSASTGTDGEVVVVATVGLSHPAWASAPDGHLREVSPDRAGPPEPVAGTINLVAWVPVPLSDAALVNAVITMTEAKAQALWNYEVDATGTASDALFVGCPAPSSRGPRAGPPEPFGGPRSTWGARLARATHAAVTAGARTWSRSAGGARPSPP